MSTQNLREQRLGETRMMNCGMKATIIDYRIRDDIDVKFEDGVIMENKSYQSFCNGNIRNPNIIKKEKIGEISYNNKGYKMQIIDYKNNKNVLIRFEETGFETIVNYKNFKIGNVKDCMSGSVYNIGIVSKNETKKGNNKIQSYELWSSMIRRCYNKDENIFKPYKDCSVCDEWLHYENFKKWFDENYYEIVGETMDLDKDILIHNNNIYSPNNCIFVPHRINLLFVKTDKVRGEYPIGVTKLPSGKFYSQCSYLDENNKISRIRKSYDNYLDAFNFYKETKEKYIKQVANEYNDKIPNKLYEALYSYEVEITD